MNYLVVHGAYGKEIEAETSEDAALEAARYCSVYDNIVGIRFRVFPAEFAKEVLVQYEDPIGTLPPNGDEFMRNYGRPKVVEEFREVEKGKFG